MSAPLKQKCLNKSGDNVKETNGYITRRLVKQKAEKKSKPRSKVTMSLSAACLFLSEPQTTRLPQKLTTYTKLQSSLFLYLTIFRERPGQEHRVHSSSHDAFG